MLIIWQWPGCQPYESSINIVEHVAGELRNASKAVLANKVANVVRRFREVQTHLHDRALLVMLTNLLCLQSYVRSHTWDPKWAPDRYDFSKFVLHELRNVSTGSYQPVIVMNLS